VVPVSIGAAPKGRPRRPTSRWPARSSGPTARCSFPRRRSRRAADRAQRRPLEERDAAGESTRASCRAMRPKASSRLSEVGAGLYFARVTYPGLPPLHKSVRVTADDAGDATSRSATSPSSQGHPRRKAAACAALRRRSATRRPATTTAVLTRLPPPRVPLHLARATAGSRSPWCRMRRRSRTRATTSRSRQPRRVHVVDADSHAPVEEGGGDGWLAAPPKCAAWSRPFSSAASVTTPSRPAHASRRRRREPRRGCRDLDVVAAFSTGGDPATTVIDCPPFARRKVQRHARRRQPP